MKPSDYEKQYSDALRERQKYESHWKEIAEQFAPNRLRLQDSDRDSGKKKHTAIINSSTVRALNVLASGMTAGITSPARLWYKVNSPIRELNEVPGVREWLADVEDIIFQELGKSNCYNALTTAYMDLGAFGNAAVYEYEDVQTDSVRFRVFPVGQWAATFDANQRPTAFYQEFSMTVEQMVEEFKKENCSIDVQNQFDSDRKHEWHKVVVCVRRATNEDEYRFPFISHWYERRLAKAGGERFLRESGFEEFPVFLPRWDVAGEDAYGTSPGMEALGDARALQLFEKRKAQLVELMVAPPMQGPSNMMNQRFSFLPGELTLVDQMGQGGGIRPLHEVNPAAVSVVRESIQDKERQVQQAFYADLFLSLSLSTDRAKTAREVIELHEEKMLQLGPVLERLETELLGPLIERTFGILWRMGKIPPPPEELQELTLKIEYISILAQAQRMMGVTALERIVSFTGAMAQYSPSVLDKINFDQVVDEYSRMVGVSPEVVNSDELVAQQRMARAQQAQQQAELQQAQAAASAVKDLGAAKLEDDTALGRLLGGLGGIATAGR